MTWLLALIDESPSRSLSARIYAIAVVGTVIVSIIATVAESAQPLWHAPAAVIGGLAIGLFVFDYGLHVAAFWLHGDTRPPLPDVAKFLMQPLALFDLAAFLPLLLLPLFGETGTGALLAVVCRLLPFLKLARHAPGLQTLRSVVVREHRALEASLFITTSLLLVSSATVWLAERDAQPDRFGDLASATWWAVVTLTTTGYGDVVPTTATGKIVAGVVSLLGLLTFALPASILANGFREEIRRRRFLVTWGLVAKVPIFNSLDAVRIAELAAVLEPSAAEAGETIIQLGDDADCMYFIVGGEVEVDAGPEPIRLREGDFFGEIALLTNRKRTATVIARTASHFMVLTRRDFRRLLAADPVLRDRMQRIADERFPGESAVAQSRVPERVF